VGFSGNLLPQNDMEGDIDASSPPSRGEVQKSANRTLDLSTDQTVIVDTLGRRVRVEWDPEAPVTPLGQLVFFSQFLATAGLFSEFVRTCPLLYSSPNAPAKQDVLGTATLAILAGHCRYAHIAALKSDRVNPQGLGMTRVCSEDSVRLAFLDTDPEACAQWQQQTLARIWEPVLKLPWVLDMDMTVKPIYGHQEGAQIGYNPHKPGRPSHTLHTWFVRGLRLVLDVEVRSGKEHAASHGSSRLWALWESLPKECRPWLACGDAGYGNEGLMSECEKRQQVYLFRLRQSGRVKALIETVSKGTTTQWVKTLKGWSATESTLRLSGWTQKRRVVVLRRARNPPLAVPDPQLPALPWKEEITTAPEYEYLVLVTSLPNELLSLVDLYLQRADAENIYDELKNQWGWGGFMTRDLHRCQVMARFNAMVYNWWSLFVRCAEPQRPREAITSRPLLLSSVGRLSESGNQLKIVLTSTHEEAGKVQRMLTQLSSFLSGLVNTAEQLSLAQRWERIWWRILTPYQTPKAALPVPSG